MCMLKHPFLKLLCILAILAQAAWSQAYEWKSVVMGGGGFVDGFVFHPKSPGILYARTDMGGAYRWVPQSSSWRPITDWVGRSNFNMMGILSIALDAQDTGKVCMLVGEYTNSWSSAYGQVICSFDGGRSFPQQVALHGKVGGNEDGRGAGERLAIDPNLGSVMYVATTRWDSVYWGASQVDVWRRGTLWKSANGGQSFDSVATIPNGNGLFVVIDPASGSPGGASQTVYASFDSSSAGKPAIWRSRDAGATWSLLPNQPANLYATHATLKGNFIFFSMNNGIGPNGVTGGKVYRYDVLDSSWTDVSPIKNAGFGYGSVSVGGQDGAHVVVSSLNRWNFEDVWLSRDNGATWSSRLLTGTLDLSFAPWKSVRKPHWLANVQINPFDSTQAFFGTGYGVFRTTTLTAPKATWVSGDSNLEEISAQQLVAPPGGVGLVSAVGDQGGFRHLSLDHAPATVHLPDVGSTQAIDVAWNLLSTFVKAHNSKNSANTYGSYSIDSAKTWVGFPTQPPGISTSSGGGTRSIAITADAGSIVWTAAGMSGPYYSKNNGTTWVACGGEVPPAGAVSTTQPVADRVNAQKIYILDQQNGLVYYSTDAGVTFTAGATSFSSLPSYGTGDGMMTATPGREGDLWVTAGNGGLLHSVNSAATFSDVPGFTAAYMVAVGKEAPGHSYPAVYVWGNIDGVTGFFRSDDSAQTWVRINDDEHQFGTFHHMAADPNTYGRIYVGTEGRGILMAQPIGTVEVRPSLVGIKEGVLQRQGMSVIATTGSPVRLYDIAGHLLQQAPTVSQHASLSLVGLPRGLYVATSGSQSLRVAVLH